MSKRVIPVFIPYFIARILWSLFQTHMNTFASFEVFADVYFTIPTLLCVCATGTNQPKTQLCIPDDRYPMP
jgi:hypothetical protein